MGWEYASLKATAQLDAHNSEKTCEHRALWWNFILSVANSAGHRMYSGMHMDVHVGTDDQPEWILADWRNGKPCAFGESHSHSWPDEPTH